MSREVHVRFCESRGVRFPPATHPVVHCDTEHQARQVRAALAERLESLGLRLHPDKTKIVYCQDNKRQGSYEHTCFTFLGYAFQHRLSKGRGELFMNFSPAISTEALKALSLEVRRWQIHRRTRLSLRELADWINPIVAGWMNYYGRFYRTKLHLLLKRINAYLMRWAERKFKRLRSYKKRKKWWDRLVQRAPRLFTHWKWVRGFWMD